MRAAQETSGREVRRFRLVSVRRVPGKFHSGGMARRSMDATDGTNVWNTCRNAPPALNQQQMADYVADIACELREWPTRQAFPS